MRENCTSKLRGAAIRPVFADSFLGMARHSAGARCGRERDMGRIS